MIHRSTTGRGFAIWEIPNSQYTGAPTQIITVQESSLATESRVWLGYRDGERMHLSTNAARSIRDALTEWLDEADGGPDA